MKDISRRLGKIEKQLNIDSTGCNDPRVYSYPNNWVELMLCAHHDNEWWQKFLQTRRSKPNPQFWDWFEQESESLRKERSKTTQMKY
jgi:hypothetical protein